MRRSGRDRARRFLAAALAGSLLAGALVAGESGAGASTCGAVPAGEWLGTWALDNAPASGGVVKLDLTFSGTGVNGIMEFATGQTVFAGGNAIVGTRPSGSCSFTADIGGVDTITGLIASNGQEISGVFDYHPGTASYTGTWQVGRVTGSAAATGSALTTDPSDAGVSAATPIATGVSTPTPGPMTIDEALVTGGALRGFSILDTVVRITAPPGTAAAPLTLTFDLDSTVTGGLPASSLTVYRNGDPVPTCVVATPPILPDPCVSVAEPLAAPQQGVHLVVLTSEASTWAFGTPSIAPTGFRVTTTSLPAGHAGQSYRQALDATGGSPPFRWKKVGKLPKGLKLSKDGVLAGTPAARGVYAVTVAVSYKFKVKRKPPVKKVATKRFTLAVT